MSESNQRRVLTWTRQYGNMYATNNGLTMRHENDISWRRWNVKSK